MEPGLQIQCQAPSEGRVFERALHGPPAVHLELVVGEALVEPPEVRDEAPASILLRLAEEGTQYVVDAATSGASGRTAPSSAYS